MSDERRRGLSSTLGGADESIAGADDSIALDLCLEQASSSLESARALLSLRKTVGRNLRVAIRCLLEAIRLIGAAEQELKGENPSPLSTRVIPLEADPQNRRAYRRLPAHFQIQLEPEHRAQRQGTAGLPLNGMTVNLSRGGMLATINRGILRHGRYLIRFLEAEEAIQPAFAWGVVRRSRARTRGWEVGIEFDDPLANIN